MGGDGEEEGQGVLHGPADDGIGQAEEGEGAWAEDAARRGQHAEENQGRVSGLSGYKYLYSVLVLYTYKIWLHTRSTVYSTLHYRDCYGCF